jgi:hypothetical protein
MSLLRDGSAGSRALGSLASARGASRLGLALASGFGGPSGQGEHVGATSAICADGPLLGIEGAIGIDESLETSAEATMSGANHRLGIVPRPRSQAADLTPAPRSIHGTDPTALLCGTVLRPTWDLVLDLPSGQSGGQVIQPRLIQR